MKFIHTGDLHYGMKPDIGKPWSTERAQAVKDALASIVRAARDEKADLLLITPRCSRFPGRKTSIISPSRP